MQTCVQLDRLVFPAVQALDFDVEARVLTDWLGLGKGQLVQPAMILFTGYLWLNFLTKRLSLATVNCAFRTAGTG